jgi:hypothetical protein
MIPFSLPLPLYLPAVRGNIDYTRFEQSLQRMDVLLVTSGVETQFIKLALKGWLKQKIPGKTFNPSQQVKFQEQSRRALRCEIARNLLGLDFRGMSVRLAESFLLQNFCGLLRIDSVRVPSKSQLERFSKWLPLEEMTPLIEQLLRQGRDEAPALKLSEAVDLDTLFIDCTCVKAHIHFPVDWVLLRDATRTLMRAVLLIRDQGLKHRMNDPEEFLHQMNGLCLKMTHAQRKSDSRKQRKKILREMKSLTKVVKNHAQRYHDLLDAQWEKTEWTRPQTQQVLKRLKNVLDQLPAAIEQAHERIIGERQVKNEDKILSLYEPDVQVVVRRKAGAEVEFGNQLLVAESPQGFIVHWELFQDRVPADATLVKDCVKAFEEGCGQKLKALGGDRGFDSAGNRQWLGQKRIFNAICPRSPKALKTRMEDEKFAALQKRRSQTEGRIGILKNDFLGRPLRVKGFKNRALAVSWAVFTHNLWVMARLPQVEEKKEELDQAA